MEIGQAIEYLKSYRKFNERYCYLLKKRADLKSRLYTIKTSSASDINVSGGLRDEAVLSLIDKITEIEQKLSIQEMQCVSKQYEIEQKIDKLDYPYCAILRKFFTENKTLERISVDLCISYPHIKRLKKIGIEKFAQVTNYEPQ